MLPARRIRLCALLAALTWLVTADGALADPATRAYVGVYLHDVTHFDQRNGTFEVDADVWLKWLGELDPGQLRVQNASADVELADLGRTSDQDWHAQRYHLRGTLRGEFPLHRFPFDEQTLGIHFELPVDGTELVPDLAGSGIADHFSITGWDYEPKFQPNVRRLVYASDLGTVAREGRSTVIDRVGFDVSLRRPTVTIAVKLFLPLVLLLLIALIALFLAPDLVDARSAIGVTVLLACFAFQFTVAGTIPDVTYLTIVDQLFILAYALSTVTLVVTVATYWLHREGRSRAALRLDRGARLILPAAAVIAAIGMLESTPRTLVRAEVPPPADSARHRSSRPTLHVGTTQLTSPASGLLRLAQRSALTRLNSHGELEGDLAEEAPTVANQRMEFHANGQMTVRWRLRAGLRWSDGHALTSDDFRFALEVSPDPQIHALSTPDDRTLEITYVDAVATALEGLAPLPRHALERDRRDGGFEAVAAVRRNRVLPTAGPYRLAEYAAGDHAVLEANPHFHGTAPALARIEVRAFRDAEAAAAAFEAGSLELMVPGSLTPQLAKDLAGRMPGRVIVRPSEDLVALVPDPSSPVLAKRIVRSALLQAIDRVAMASAIYGAEGAVAETPTRGLAARAIDEHAFDLAAAHAVLEAEGKLGATLRLTFQGRALDRRIAGIVGESLTAAGLVVELREVPPGSPESRALDHGGLMLTTIRSGDEDADPCRLWNLPRVQGRYDHGARNFAYDDATADIVDRWSRALYPERRRQLRQAIDLEVAHRLPLLPLVFGTERVAAVESLRGWSEGKRFGDVVADWYFEGATP